MLLSPDATVSNLLALTPEVAPPDIRQQQFAELQETIDVGDEAKARLMAGELLGLETIKDASELPGGVEFEGIFAHDVSEAASHRYLEDDRARADEAVMRVGMMVLRDNKLVVHRVDGQACHFVAKDDVSMTALRAFLAGRGYRHAEGGLAPIEQAYQEIFSQTGPDAPAIENGVYPFPDRFTNIAERLYTHVPAQKTAAQQIDPQLTIVRPSYDGDTIFDQAPQPGPTGTRRMSPSEREAQARNYDITHQREINEDTPPMSTFELLNVASRSLRSQGLLMAAQGSCRIGEARAVHSQLTPLIDAVIVDRTRYVELSQKQLEIMTTALRSAMENGKTAVIKREAEDALNHFIAMQVYPEDIEPTEYAKPTRFEPLPPAPPRGLAKWLSRVLPKRKRGRHARR